MADSQENADNKAIAEIALPDGTTPEQAIQELLTVNKNIHQVTDPLAGPTLEVETVYRRGHADEYHQVTEKIWESDGKLYLRVERYSHVKNIIVWLFYCLFILGLMYSLINADEFGQYSRGGETYMIIRDSFLLICLLPVVYFYAKSGFGSPLWVAKYYAQMLLNKKNNTEEEIIQAKNIASIDGDASTQSNQYLSVKTDDSRSPSASLPSIANGESSDVSVAEIPFPPNMDAGAALNILLEKYRSTMHLVQDKGGANHVDVQEKHVTGAYRYGNLKITSTLEEHLWVADGKLWLQRINYTPDKNQFAWLMFVVLVLGGFILLLTDAFSLHFKLGLCASIAMIIVSYKSAFVTPQQKSSMYAKVLAEAQTTN